MVETVLKAYDPAVAQVWFAGGLACSFHRVRFICDLQCYTQMFALYHTFTFQLDKQPLPTPILYVRSVKASDVLPSPVSQQISSCIIYYIYLNCFYALVCLSRTPCHQLPGPVHSKLSATTSLVLCSSSRVCDNAHVLLRNWQHFVRRLSLLLTRAQKEHAHWGQGSMKRLEKKKPYRRSFLQLLWRPSTNATAYARLRSESRQQT